MSSLILKSNDKNYVNCSFQASSGRTWHIQNWENGNVFGIFHSDTSSFNIYTNAEGDFFVKRKVIASGEVWTPGLRLAAYGDGAGISLYGGEGDAHTPQYGLMFAKTANFGCYGQVTGDWATYFTMDGNDDRGWIFRLGSNNVASIGSNGIFDGKAYVGRCNGVTNSIFSQNEHYTHYNTDAPNGHWFNTDVRVQGRVYCGDYYNKKCFSELDIIPIGNGGTGAETAAQAAVNLLSKSTNNGNINDKIDYGFSWLQLGSCTNTPYGDNPSNRYGFLEVMTPWYGSMECLQRYTDYTTGDTFVRDGINSFWKPWVRYLTSNNYTDYTLPASYWNWHGNGGQPTWLWGGNEYGNFQVWNPANFSVNYANSSGYATSSNYSNSSGWTNASNTYESGNSITQSTTADTLFAAQGSGVSCAFMASGPTNNYADVLYWSGYQKWGGTQLAVDYNAQARPLLAVRKYNQTYSNWGHWGYIHTSSFQQNFGNSLPTSGMVYGDIYYVC